MLKDVAIEIDLIYVPVKHTRAFDADKVQSLAEDILENGQMTPIRLRADGQSFVLVEGLHRRRTPGAFEYRAANISHVLAAQGRRWLPGLIPAKNVGRTLVLERQTEPPGCDLRHESVRGPVPPVRELR